MSAARVLILQAMCKHYRAPLFARMYEELSSEGVALSVAYSEPIGSHRKRDDDVQLPSTYGIKIPAHFLFGGKFLWQMPLRQILNADLIIVEHAVKHLVNLPLLLLSRLRLKKLGFWVHGGTLRHPSSSMLLPYRTWSMLAADWIFSYTSGVSSAAVTLGADPGRVTALQNAIDLSSFRKALENVSPSAIAHAREALGFESEAHVALFCGSIYEGRGADFLVAVGDYIYARDTNFHLILIGAGPLQSQIERDALTRPWLHPLGSIFGDARALYFRLASVSLMPYQAGLGVLDGMAAGLPLIVTGASAINPEIDYLVDGVTGLVTGDDMEVYAQAITALFSDPARLGAMSEASRAASQQYSIETMAANFCRGIRGCLALPRT